LIVRRLENVFHAEVHIDILAEVVADTGKNMTSCPSAQLRFRTAEEGHLAEK
jgi:hypothetical protein